MRSRVAAWFDSMAGVTTLPAVETALGLATQELGFQHFIHHGCFPGSPRGTGEVHLDTTPAKWRDYRIHRGMDASWDLLYSGALRAAAPVPWSRIRRLHPALFESARDFGLATGVTQPMRGPAGAWSSISFIKRRAGARAERGILAALPHCQLLTSLTHDAVARIVASPSDVSMPSPPCESALSERESVCLGLAASGKTILQIAALMPITARTVVFHLANARRKLRAGSLRHAVTKAASLGLIRAA